MTQFKAFEVTKEEDGSFSRTIIERDTNDLPEGDVLVRVTHSSLNYKDALSATGNPGVTRNYPHTPGIDAAGVVETSSDPSIAEGTEVIVIGFDLGMNTAGGFGEYISIPAGWVTPLPAGLTVRESMILGTAGFTAALCIHKLEGSGLSTSSGPVLVTGATGGVGSVAVRLLSQVGYETHAVTGKANKHDFLRSLGASEIHNRSEFDGESSRPLLRETWGGVVDTVGGAILFNCIKALKYGQSAAACGLVSSPMVPASVFPFILRHVNLLGIDSVELPLDQKNVIWSKLASEWKIDNLEELVEPLALDSLSAAIDRILAGEMVGRGLLTHST